MSHTRRIFVSLLLAVLLLAALALPVLAQEGSRVVTDDEVNRIAKDLFCPVCESTPLDVCPTQACADWREVIRTKIGQGQSDDEIKQYFVDQYGARVLSSPPQEGFNLAAWIAPIAAVLIGAFLFTRYLRRIRSEAESTSAPVPAQEVGPADDYAARIERELQER